MVIIEIWLHSDITRIGFGLFHAINTADECVSVGVRKGVSGQVIFVCAKIKRLQTIISGISDGLMK